MWLKLIMTVHYQGPKIRYCANLNKIHSIHDLSDGETAVLRMKEQVLVKVKCVISEPSLNQANLELVRNLFGYYQCLVLTFKCMLG